MPEQDKPLHLLFSRKLEGDRLEVMCSACTTTFPLDNPIFVAPEVKDDVVFTVKCPKCEKVSAYYDWYNW